MQIEIPFYHILNDFLVGLIFIIGYSCIFPKAIIEMMRNEAFISLVGDTKSIYLISFLAIAYEVGLIINRIGSVFLEKLLKRIKFIYFNDNYKKFNICKKEFPILGDISREYALSRTSIILFMVLTVLALVSGAYVLSTVLFMVTIIFLFSVRKYSKKIIDIMDKYEPKENR